MTAPAQAEGRKRILTGIRPTGALHLGHYAGALENWVRLQDEYDCYFLIADYQVSDHADDIARVREAVWEVALDWLAVGLDPQRSHFVIESLVPEHAELTTWLSWFLPVSMLERNPTLRAEMEAIEHPDDPNAERKAVPVAFYNYPVMQVANILLPRAHLVPTGDDQLPHIELTRETARRFNHRFKPVFPEPGGLLGRAPRLVGVDGNAKMSKGKNNAIYLKDDAATVTRKVMGMYTPRMSRTDAGDPEATPAFMYHDVFNADGAEVEDLKARYRLGNVGDVEVKQKLARALNVFLDPVRERRAHYEKDMGYVREALARGSAEERAIGSETMAMVRDALDLDYLAKH
ncbi:MAG: tryptophan--tRNA ligase [Tepidiformaceae bacterium]